MAWYRYSGEKPPAKAVVATPAAVPAGAITDGSGAVLTDGSGK